MPKVKTTLKSDSTSNAKEKGDAISAARLKVIEASAQRLIPAFKSQADLADRVKKSMFEIFEAVRAESTKHSFEKNETSKMLTAALAKVYCDGDESAVSGNMTANTLKSKFLRLVHPVDSKAAKELDKALAKGVDFNAALNVARGNVTAAQVNKKSTKGGAREKGGNSIDDEDTFGNLVSALVSKALDGGKDHPKYKGGLSLDDMETKFAEVLAGFREKLEETPEAESEE